eukprot:COSAG01_NODE_14902_length_1397_cov_1.434515_1_plen_69_part_00
MGEIEWHWVAHADGRDSIAHEASEGLDLCLVCKEDLARFLGHLATAPTQLATACIVSTVYILRLVQAR